MSGHSKWSTIKHQKQATDKTRGQVFTKLGNAITLAVGEGGGSSDLQFNFKLRLSVEKAKAANMPKENIARAIEKGMGKGASGNDLAEVVYEGFAPLGVAVLVQGVTDNKQRTVSAVKNIFAMRGGSLGSSGSVAYMFKNVGEIVVTKEGQTYDQLLEFVLETGAQDLEETPTHFVIFTKPNQIHQIKTKVEQKLLAIVSSELTFRPTIEVEVAPSDASQIIEFLTALEELDDIHKVHANAHFL